MHALVREPASCIIDGERTHVARVPIDCSLAAQQHANYVDMLRGCGVQVRVLASAPDLPDAVFIEDTALVLDEVAVIASMGAPSRRGERAAVAQEMERYRELIPIEAPALIEGGDVLRLGRTLLVGVSARSNMAGLQALETALRRFGYQVRPVPVRACLHLKTACTALPDETLLLNPSWLDAAALRPYETLTIPDVEPWGANVLAIGATVCAAAEYPRTAELIRGRGFAVRTTPLSEFAKAEGGVTCLSLIYK